MRANHVPNVVGPIREPRAVFDQSGVLGAEAVALCFVRVQIVGQQLVLRLQLRDPLPQRTRHMLGALAAVFCDVP
jgi:hypothetical protein